MDANTNQWPLLNFLFHFVKTVLDAELAREKNFILTPFTPRKCRMWITCGLTFEIFHLHNLLLGFISFEFWSSKFVRK